MPASATSAAPGGPHTPVSNMVEEAGPVQTRSAGPPSQGTNTNAAPVNDDGTEAVQGHTRTEATPAELWSPPEVEGLRDIGEASFGPPPPAAEVVIGPDDRVQITNTVSYPWRVHASLLIKAADNSTWIGTAWFIGPHTLMTAGHVVYIKNSGVPGRDGWVKSINVMPGRNGSALPYGSVSSSEFHSVTGWTTQGREQFDYGAIVIPTDLGNTTGWLSFGVYSDADLVGSFGNISGYPGDKPSGTQWYDSQAMVSVKPRKVYYQTDTAGGQSGSAVYRIVSGDRYAVGIHAYGDTAANSATRITTPVYNNMVAWNT